MLVLLDLTAAFDTASQHLDLPTGALRYQRHSIGLVQAMPLRQDFFCEPQRFSLLQLPLLAVFHRDLY